MIRRILLSASLALVLSCQNGTDAPSAPQEGTGALALRVVSAQALTRVDSVMASLTWSSGSKLMRKSWMDSTLEITGLPRKETISVHMEGWSWVQGRRVVSWSGDTTAALESGPADWDMKTSGAPIRIVPVTAPSPSAILPDSDSIVGGILAVGLSTGRTDTIRLDTTGVDSVYLGKSPLRKENGKFLLVVESGMGNDTVLVVGHKGQTSWFRVFVSAPVVAVDLHGHTLMNDTLRVVLVSSRTDTVRMDTAGIDSVVQGGGSVASRSGTFPLAATPSTDEMVRVVGRNGSAVTFRILGSAKPLSRDALVSKPAFASWNRDTLVFEHDERAADTIAIDTAGVDSVVAADSLRRGEGGSHRIVVAGARMFKVVVTGKAGQKLVFHVVASASARIENKPGLGARLLSPANTTVGRTCLLRVRIDSGEVASVVLQKDGGIPLEKGTDSVWTLAWPTVGTSDSLGIHVHGKGQGGKLDTIRIGKKLSFDREGPAIVLPAKTLLVGRAGGSIAWSIADASGIDSIWFQGLAGMPCVENAGAWSCRADGVGKSFSIHARDALGNDSQATVAVVTDSVAPRLESVSIPGGRDLGRTDDTLWVDSGMSASIRWKANDSLRGFDAWLKKANAFDSILKNRPKAGGWDTATGLDAGAWTLAARDSFDNKAIWGTFVVAVKPAEVKPPVDTTKELAMELVQLPEWVGRKVQVTLKRTAGRVDSVVWSGPKFTTTDSTYWTAIWTPDTTKTVDSLKVKAYGHTAVEGKVVAIVRRVNLDRTGPKIRLLLPAGQSGDTFHVAVIARDSLRILATDTNRIGSIWLTGTDAVLDPSGAGAWAARMKAPGYLMAHARDTLGNEDSLHVHVVFDPSASDTGGPTLDSVVGARGKLNSTTNIPRVDDKGRVDVKVYANEPKFLVKLWTVSGEAVDTILELQGIGGIARVDTIPMEHTGSVYMGLFDSIGNLGSWYDYNVLPFVHAPSFPDPSGVYGSDRIVIEEGVEKLRTRITCPDSGKVLRRLAAGGGLLVINSADVDYAGSVSYKYLCVDPTSYAIRSDTVKHEITLLLRPEFVTDSQSFSGALTVQARMNNWNDTIPNAGIQYCLGDSAICSAAGAKWSSAIRSESNFSFVITAASTVGIRVAVGDAHSHASYRMFTKNPVAAPTVYPKGGIMGDLYVYNFNPAGSLVVSIACSGSDGNNFLQWRDSGSHVWSTDFRQKDSLEVGSSKSLQFVCTDGVDESEIVTQTYTILKPPIIYPTNPSFAGDSLDIVLAPWDGKPLDTATTSYLSCVGPEYSTGNPEQRWCADGGQGWYDGREYKGGDFRVGLWYGETSQTVWSKIVYKGVKSISNKRTYTSTTRTSW